MRQRIDLARLSASRIGAFIMASSAVVAIVGAAAGGCVGDQPAVGADRADADADADQTTDDANSNQTAGDATANQTGDAQMNDGPASDGKTGDGATGPTDAAPLDAGDGAVEANDAAGDASPDAPDGSPTCAISAGLVRSWPFGEGTGASTADMSGNGNPGTLMNSPAWSTSHPQQLKDGNSHSLCFDGIQSYVTMGNPTALQITGTLSVAAWIQSTASQLGSYRTVLGKWWSGGAEAAYSLVWVTGDGLSFNVNSASNEQVGASETKPLNDGDWHLLVGTWDGATVSLYVDGAPVSSQTFDGGFGPIANITDPFDVATDNRYDAGTGDRFFPGCIDEVRVYNRALTAAEVGWLYDGQCAAVE